MSHINVSIQSLLVWQAGEAEHCSTQHPLARQPSSTHKPIFMNRTVKVSLGYVSFAPLTPIWRLSLRNGS